MPAASTAFVIASVSDALRRMSAARTFSSRCPMDVVPGMSTVAGERCSSHASASCDELAPNSRPIFASGLSGPTRPP